MENLLETHKKFRKELVGDPALVPVLNLPPLTHWDTKEPEQDEPSSCSVRQMNGSILCVSPCLPNAVPGDPFTP